MTTEKNWEFYVSGKSYKVISSTIHMITHTREWNKGMMNLTDKPVLKKGNYKILLIGDTRSSVNGIHRKIKQSDIYDKKLIYISPIKSVNIKY